MSRTLASPGEPLPGAMNIGRRRALRIGADRAALTVLLLAACMAVLTFRDYGVTWDEPGLRTYGQMLVAWYGSGFADASAFSFANLRYYGGAFDIMATLLEPWTGLDPYAWRHLLGAMVGLAGLTLIWRLGRRLGGPGAGLLALLLLATLPGWWGHMFFNSKDVPFAVGMLASLAIWVRCLEEWPEPRLRSALLLGLAVGLTLGVRVGGIMLGLIVAPSLALLLAADARRFGWSAAAHAAAGVVLRLLPALPVALAVLLPAWPWVALAPGNFLEAVGYLSHFPYSADTIFAGQRYPAPAVPLGYWPTLLALQLPEVVLAGLLLAAGIAMARPWRPVLTTGDRRALGLVTVAAAALLPLAYAMLARPTSYNLLRHFIFVLPPLMILAGLGLDRALRLVPPGWRLASGGLVAIGLMLPLLRIAQLHPYAYVYFNDLSGGVAAAAGRYELDYWGTSFGELGRNLEASLSRHPDALGLRPIPARICGPFETAQAVLPPSLLPVHHDAPARLAVAIDIFFCVPPAPGDELARVERAGVVLSRAYRTRPDALITSFSSP